MGFKTYMNEAEDVRIDELFGMGSSKDKEAIKKMLSDVMKNSSDVKLNLLHDTLGKLAKAGNILADKLIKELSFNPKNVQKVYAKATK